MLDEKKDIIIRIMENSKERLIPYFRIYDKFKNYFNSLGEIDKKLDLTHFDLNKFSVQEIVELFEKALEFTLNLKNNK